MSSTVNKVILIGRLGADPELRYTSTGHPRCNMRIATAHRYKDKTNEWQERTSWHTVIAWGKQGELCKEYLGKGRRVFVEGRLDNRAYTAKDGQQRYAHEVVSDSVVFLDRRQEAAAIDAGGSAVPPAAAPAESAIEEDLPF